jgi:hypothetical protein
MLLIVMTVLLFLMSIPTHESIRVFNGEEQIMKYKKVPPSEPNPGTHNRAPLLGQQQMSPPPSSMLKETSSSPCPSPASLTVSQSGLADCKSTKP